MKPDPVIVQPAANPAAELRAAFELFQSCGRKRLEAAIVIGEILTARKKACGHGNWLKWLETHFPQGRQRAADFIRVFANRGKCSRAATFEDALESLAPEPEPEPKPEADPNVAARLHLEPSEDDEPEPGQPGADGDSNVSARIHLVPQEEHGEPEPEEPADEAPSGDEDEPVENAPALEPNNRPSWMKPGNNTDPENAYYDLLTAFSALAAKLTKAINAENGDRLLHALTLLTNVTRKTHMVLYTSEVIEGAELKGGQVKFIGLRPLRALIRRAGAAKRKLNQEQVNKAFDAANDPDGKDGDE